ncbi:hypothetical protein, conserved [Thermococcus kodakarensis KOD1]|uniref:HTH cro/C1-type domain-containing protein n=1 Tax=Thermococcus kodakarensis (strain ATCC BAA-918 / JCM 12380 / KOD1) TaxID=69014 RepID=Q5JIH5_THEKO|nr:hypothetical protein [Thermococcus kodakarensis]WCN27877.1 hypothetical protein POG15_10225 [Thermococcus kodakarensis]WCN30175.1 hypothetical protein POG21_10210 [Thermococcus kodakarensis]BAD86195.1 hypothetical protein, conserved [Thermococcus kodakarensis KOD1]
MSEAVNPKLYSIEKLLEDKDKRLLVSEVVLKLAEALGVTVEDFLGYMEWKENMGKLERAEKEAQIPESIPVEFPTEDAPEGLEEALNEIEEDIQKWQKIERRLKEMGLEL